MNNSKHQMTGWALVGIQAVLLLTLVLLGSSDDWPTPTWLRTASTVTMVIGIGAVLVAATGLGRLVTPTPVPKQDGELVTTGLYGVVRHPIYTGVLAIVVALVVPSGSWVTLAVGVVTIGFFYAKSTWEEQRLREQYSGYADYQASTPRFFPRLPN